MTGATEVAPSPAPEAPLASPPAEAPTNARA